MRKLFYIANIRFPTERAHGIQVAYMCSAFAGRHGTDAEKEHGIDTEKMQVTLLVPDRETFSEDPFEYYGIERNFTVEKIPVPDIVQFGAVGFFIESLIFAYRAARRILNSSFPKGGGDAASQRILNPSPHQNAVLPLEKGESEAVVYTREELPLLFLPRRRAFYEAHQMRRSFFFRFLIKRARGIVAISQGLKNALIGAGVPEGNILVARDGYDDKVFAAMAHRTEVRHLLGLPNDKRVALYIGGLEAWKGPQTLCDAAPLLMSDDVIVVVIGGTTEELKIYRIRYPLVNFLGVRPYTILPLVQQAADVLVVPNSATTELGGTFTSPLKLFAHMASNIPLVVSDVPAIREVLTDDEAEFFSPDNPRDLARAIRDALSGKHKEKPSAALRLSSEYSWDKRAEHVITYIRQCQNTHESS